MTALGLVRSDLPARAPAVPARIALLGTGTVGRAVLARLAAWRDTPFEARVALAYVANSRQAVCLDPAGGEADEQEDVSSLLADARVAR